MNCKHVKVVGNTTKHWHCNLKDKAVDDYRCKGCLMKLPLYPEGFEEVFAKGFRK